MMIQDKIWEVAAACIGTNEGTGRHQTILDIYNQFDYPGKRPYNIGRNDPWCAAFVSAVFIAAGAASLIPVECSCYLMKNLANARGIVRDPGRYVPKRGDVVFYKWAGKNVVSHVGIVTAVNGSALEVTEGNFNDSVGVRKIKLSYPYIDSYIEVK